MEVYLHNWYHRFMDELPRTKRLRIVSPFVKDQIVHKVHEVFNFKNLELITRYNMMDFASNVSSIDALLFAVVRGASVFGIRQLHSKVYLFDRRAAIVTSANLTSGGLLTNYECGIFITDSGVIEKLHRYVDDLKAIAGPQLETEQCERWRIELLQRQEIYNTFISSLPDYGATPFAADKTKQYFVKFFGSANNRVPFSFLAREEVTRALCHYACCFSVSPRQFRTGDVIYMGRMTSPNDYAIFGRAKAVSYVSNRDRASAAELLEREWKKKWPLYIRVTSSRFIDTSMGNCVMLYDLIRNLDYQSFSSTLRRYHAGERDIRPAKALAQKQYVKLTHQQDFIERLPVSDVVV
jgi:hypothetical protein